MVGPLLRMQGDGHGMRSAEPWRIGYGRGKTAVKRALGMGPELRLHDFSGAFIGKLGRNSTTRGTLWTRTGPAPEARSLVLRSGVPGTRHDERLDLLAQPRIGNADDGDE